MEVEIFGTRAMGAESFLVVGQFPVSELSGGDKEIAG
jgi:hypothetical protein